MGRDLLMWRVSRATGESKRGGEREREMLSRYEGKVGSRSPTHRCRNLSSPHYPKTLEEFLQIHTTSRWWPIPLPLSTPLPSSPLTYSQLATVPSGVTPGEERGKDFLLAWEAPKLVEPSGLKTRKRALSSFALQLQASLYPIFDAYVPRCVGFCTEVPEPYPCPPSVGLSLRELHCWCPSRVSGARHSADATVEMGHGVLLVLTCPSSGEPPILTSGWTQPFTQKR
jgi:hypothetical protein